MLVVLNPAGIASAHGYVSSPASRQAQCAQHVVSCGQIQYEPQSVGWRAAKTGRTVTFNWTFTARHRTSNYQYFIGGQKIAEVSGNNQPPPSTVAHSVNLGSHTGRQTVLAVWNIADTANAFYACIDLQVS